MINIEPKKSLKEVFINDWKEMWNDRPKKLKFIIDTSRITIFCGVTMLWLFFVFMPADTLVKHYNDTSHPDHLLAFWAALGPILPIVLYYVMGDYWVGRGIVEVVRRLDL